MKSVTLAGLCAALICAGSQQSQAGISPPIISGSYYEQSGTQNCGPSISSSSGASSGGVSSVNICQLLYQAPPAGKQFALDSVACHATIFNFNNGQALKDVYLAQNVNGSISRKHMLRTELQADVPAEFAAYFTVSEYPAGSYLVVAPVRIVMDVVNPTTMTLDCHITGTLRSTPP